MSSKIVVIAPIRDEAWILDRFHWACSQFADHILVLDQGSMDGSVEICAKYPKVTVLENPSANYNEAERSRLLVEHARRLFGAGNLLLAFDADEIPTFPSLDHAVWAGLRDLRPGTQVCFQKPEILSSPLRCVRSGESFPYGFVDDGSPMEGTLIHSLRIPESESGERVLADRAILMHFARMRWREYCTRQALYCVIENLNGTKSHRMRSCYYAPSLFGRAEAGGTEPIPVEWTSGYLAAGIDVFAFTSSRFNNYHVRVLRYFAECGSERFNLDPIWWEDWEAARQHFTQQGFAGLPKTAIKGPSLVARSVVECLVRLYLLSSSTAGLVRKCLRARSGVPITLGGGRSTPASDKAGG